MKKIALLLIVMVTGVFSSFAQKNIDPAKAEEIFNAKVKYMQEQLLLTPAQTTQFIPVYKNYLTTIRGLKRPDKKNIQVTTTDQAYNIIKSEFDFKRGIINAQEKAIGQMKSFLTPQQLMKFMSAERRIQGKIRGAKEFKGKGANNKDRSNNSRQCKGPKGNFKVQTAPAPNTQS